MTPLMFLVLNAPWPTAHGDNEKAELCRVPDNIVLKIHGGTLSAR